MARLVGLLLWALAPAPLWALASGPQDAFLERLRAEDGRPQIESTLAIDSADLALAFECFVSNSLPLGEGELTEALSAPQRRWLLQVVFPQHLERLRQLLRDLVTETAGQDVRRAAIDLLAEIGSASDVQWLMRTASELSGGSEALHSPLKQALTSILRRDQSLYPRLWNVIQHSELELLTPLVEAVRDAASPQGLLALARLIDVEPSLRVLVLDVIATLARNGDPPFDSRIVEPVRACIDSSDENVIVGAIAAAGELGDHEAIPAMIEGLRSSALPIRGAALTSLRTISGLSFSSDARRWEAWHRDEMRWWSERAHDVFALLRDGTPSEVNSVIGELVTRRLFRDELAEQLIPLLEDSEDSMRRVACQGLGQVRSRIALEELVQSLEDQDPTVQAAAQQALRSITNRNDLTTPEEWRTVTTDVPR